MVSLFPTFPPPIAVLYKQPRLLLERPQECRPQSDKRALQRVLPNHDRAVSQESALLRVGLLPQGAGLSDGGGGTCKRFMSCAEGARNNASSPWRQP
jgi:hypothetical protein